MAVEIGAILEGKVTGITNFGAFVELPDKTTGMVHISEVSSSFIKDIHEESRPKHPAGDRPKRNQPPVWTGTQKSEPQTMSFEDMMAKFKSVSDEKMSDLKKNNVAKRGASVPRRGGNSRG